MNRATLILTALVLFSALSVVTIRHENRLEFIALQKQESHRNFLQENWGRLMLERATWQMQHSVAENAVTQLGMAAPKAEEIITVQLEK